MSEQSKKTRKYESWRASGRTAGRSTGWWACAPSAPGRGSQRGRARTARPARRRGAPSGRGTRRARGRTPPRRGRSSRTSGRVCGTAERRRRRRRRRSRECGTGRCPGRRAPSCRRASGTAWGRGGASRSSPPQRVARWRRQRRRTRARTRRAAAAGLVWPGWYRWPGNWIPRRSSAMSRRSRRRQAACSSPNRSCCSGPPCTCCPQGMLSRCPRTDCHRHRRRRRRRRRRRHRAPAPGPPPPPAPLPPARAERASRRPPPPPAPRSRRRCSGTPRRR